MATSGELRHPSAEMGRDPLWFPLADPGEQGQWRSAWTLAPGTALPFPFPDKGPDPNVWQGRGLVSNLDTGVVQSRLCLGGMESKGAAPSQWRFHCGWCGWPWKEPGCFKPGPAVLCCAGKCCPADCGPGAGEDAVSQEGETEGLCRPPSSTKRGLNSQGQCRAGPKSSIFAVSFRISPA